MSDDRRLSVVSALDDCVQREREGMVRFLECLGEFDAREWYSFEAISSSFAYLTEHLKIPPGSAWKRLVVARAARRFPVILSLLREGKVHLTGLSLVAKMLDESNVDFILEAITGKTTRQIEESVADFKAQASGDSKREGSTSLKGSLTPLGLGNWKVEFVADAELKALMDSAMELCPIGTDLASIVRMALEAFVQRKATRKFGAPRREPAVVSSSENGSASGVDESGERSRYISASTRRAVYERDEPVVRSHGDAAVSSSSIVLSSTFFLEASTDIRVARAVSVVAAINRHGEPRENGSTLAFLSRNDGLPSESNDENSLEDPMSPLNKLATAATILASASLLLAAPLEAKGRQSGSSSGLSRGVTQETTHGGNDSFRRGGSPNDSGSLDIDFFKRGGAPDGSRGSVDNDFFQRGGRPDTSKGDVGNGYFKRNGAPDWSGREPRKKLIPEEELYFLTINDQLGTVRVHETQEVEIEFHTPDSKGMGGAAAPWYLIISVGRNREVVQVNGATLKIEIPQDAPSELQVRAISADGIQSLNMVELRMEQQGWSGQNGRAR